MSRFSTDKYLTPTEDLMLSFILNKKKSRDTLMLTLLRKYGMRQSEMLMLRPCDINVEIRTMKIQGLKGSNSRELPLTDELFARIMYEVSKCPGDDMKIFPIGRKRLFAIWAFYRPVKKPLHALRHSFGVEMYKKTKDLHLVKNLLGHKSIASTMIYLDFVQSQEEFRKALVG